MKAWAGATYGFLAPPRSSNEPHPHPDGSRYSASFPVKHLGSGPVQHYTDYDGCLQTMNKLFSSHQLSNKRRLRRRSNEDKCELFLTFTPKRLFIVNKGTQVLEEMCKLEAVYLVHPHPTKDRLFGVLTDNWMSGTLHCSAYLTIDNTTGSDVLYGFRKACRIWTDLHQPSEDTSSSEPAPSKAISSVPSGEYDRLEAKTPPELLVSYSDSSCKKKLSQESTNLSKITKLTAALSDLRSLNLTDGIQSSSTSSQFTSQSSQDSTESRNTELQPLLFGLDSTITASTSFDLGGENSESRSLSVRRVSFAPSVVTSETTVPKTTLGSKLKNNMRSMVVGNSSTSSSSGYPRLSPREYPPPVSPDSSAHTSQAMQSLTPSEVDPPICGDLIDFSAESSLKTVNTESGGTLGSGTNSLSLFQTLSQDSIQDIERPTSLPAIFVQAEPRSKTSGSSNTFPKSQLTDQRLSESTMSDSDSLMSVSSSSIISSDCSNISSLEQSLSNLREMAVGLSDTSSLHRSIHQLSDTNSDWTGTSDFSLPISQNVPKPLNVGSSTSTVSSSIMETSTKQASPQPRPSCALETSPSTVSSSIMETSTKQASPQPGPSSALETSLPRLSCVQSQSALAKLFNDYTTDSSDSFLSEIMFTTLFKELESSSSGTLSSSGSSASEVTLAKLFKDLATQTSRVSSQFNTLGRLMCDSSDSSSDTTLAERLLEQKTNQLSTAVSSEASSNEPFSSKSSLGTENASLGLAVGASRRGTSSSTVSSKASSNKPFTSESSLGTERSRLGLTASASRGGTSSTTVSSEASSNKPFTSESSLGTERSRLGLTASASRGGTSSTTVSSDSSKPFSSESSLGTESASLDLTASISSGGTLPNLFKEDSNSLNATTSSEPAITMERGSTTTNTSNISSQGTDSTKWSEFNSSQSSSLTEPELSLPAALLSLTRSALCTSFTVTESNVIDLPSLMETLRHVTSLLASSHAILDLSLSTLKEKLASQPSGVCVCTCQGRAQKEGKKDIGRNQEDASLSLSEPVLLKSQ